MEQTIALLIAYKYQILFPIATFEGPLITVVAGYLITLQFLDPLITYLIILASDLAGDAMYYAIGRWGGTPFLERHGKKLGITEEKVVRASAYFTKHHNKAIVFSKLVHGIGVAGLLAIGSLKAPFGRFLTVCGITSIFQTAILLAIGILFGKTYEQVGKYLDYYAATGTVLALAIIVFLVIKYIKVPTT